MGKRTPTSPTSAHHRYMRSMVATHFGDKKVQPTPEEFDKVSSVFKKAGGSWERLFKGSISDVNLLKRIFKVAVKDDILTKSQRW